MVDCKDAAKVLITKKLISNPWFRDTVESISRQYAELADYPVSAEVIKRQNFLDEALEIAYETTLLDLPRWDLQKVRVLNKFKKLWFEKQKQLYDLVDDLKYGTVDLPEGEIDDILAKFNVSKEQFEVFVDDLSRVSNKKIVTEFVRNEKFNIKKVFDRLADEETKTNLKLNDEVYENIYIQFEKAIAAVVKKDISKVEIRKIFKDYSENQFKKLKKDKEVFKKIMDIYDTAIDEYLNTVSKKVIQTDQLIRADYREAIKNIKAKFKTLSREEFNSYIDDENVYDKILTSYEWAVDDVFDVTDKEFRSMLIPEDGLSWDELASTKAINKKLLDERQELFRNYILSKTILDETLDIDDYTIFLNLVKWTPSWDVNASTINSLTTIEDLRNLLTFHLKEFKDKDLLQAFKTRMDELSYGKDTKLVKLLKWLEKSIDDKKSFVEQIADAAPKKKQPVKKTVKKVDTTSYEHSLLSFLSKKPVWEWEIYFYEKDFSWYSEETLAWSNAFQQANKKHAIKIWDATAIKKTDIKEWMNVVVENIMWAKEIEKLWFDPIQPNLVSEWQAFNFFMEDWVLYLGTKTEADYEMMKSILDWADIKREWADMSQWIDWYMDAMKVRYWDDLAWAVAEVRERFTWKDNIPEQEAYIEDILKASPYFSLREVDKKAFVESLPDWVENYKWAIDFYYNKALQLADRFNVTIQPKETWDIKKMRQLYWDIAYIEPSKLEQWSDNVQEFLDAFGATGWVIEDSTFIATQIKAVNAILKDWFAIPWSQYNTTFQKLRRGERIDDEHFVTTFITKNKDKLAERQWFTLFDKAKSYLTEKLEEAKTSVMQDVTVDWTEWWFGTYFVRDDNPYMDMLSDTDWSLYTWDSKDIEKDFWRIFEVFEDYYKDVEAMIKDWASELEHYYNSRKARSAIAEYEENFLLKKYKWVLNNKDILTKRYDVFKITKADELPLLRERIDQIKASFEPVIKPEVDLKDAKKSFVKKWFAFVGWTSVTLDDAIAIELKKSKWEISNIRNRDLSWFSNSDKYKILENLRAARIAESLWNTASRIYERLFPSLKWFFNDYELIKAANGAELPKMLAKTNATGNMDVKYVLNNTTDLDIKSAIMDKISPLVKEWKLTSTKLTEIVTSQLKLSDIPEWIESATYIKNYVRVFRPYELLVKIPDSALKDFSEKVMKDLWTIDRDLIDDIPVTIDWRQTSLRDILNEPETTFPKVIYGEQKFAKVEMDAAWEYFIKNTEKNMSLLKDEIDFAQDALDWIQTNIFKESQLILDKAPRLKRLKDILFTTADSAQAAWNVIGRISNKEELVWIQQFVSQYINLSDEQFFALKNSDKVQFAWEAWIITDYYRRLNRLLPDTASDAWAKEVFKNSEKKFLSMKFNDIQLKSMWVSTKRWQIFAYIPYKKLDLAQEKKWWGLVNIINDPVELAEFNRVFSSELTMDDFQRIMIWLADWELTWFLQKTVNYYKRFMGLKLLWGKYARILTSRPYAMLTLHQQIFGYKTMEYWLNNVIGNMDYKKVWEVRRWLGILSWEIPELSNVKTLLKNTIADAIWTRWAQSIWDAINEIKNANTWFIFDSVKDNANNLVDVFYSGSIKNRVFMDSVLTNKVKSFSNFEDFENWLSKAPVSEREYVLEAIQRQSVEQFENLMWFNNLAILEWTWTWVRASLWKIFEITTWFRSWWWLNVAKRAFKKLSKFWEISHYLVKNWFSPEARENAVQYFLKDRDMQMFMNQVMYDIYYATKLKRFIETRTWDDSEDETFFEFIWNELTDYKWWTEAFATMSQGYQWLYSAWPLRPFLFSMEAFIWERDWGIAWAFVEWLRGSAFRQFKLLNNLSVAWMKIAWESQLDWVQRDETQDIFRTFLRETSAWTLRYVMNDKDYQKSLFYIPDAHDPKEVLLGINTNPYIEAEARMQRIAAEQTLENDLPRAMRDLLYWTYAWKLFNTIKWGIQYWLGSYNLRDKTDMKQIIEDNPVYQDYINNWTINIKLLPEEYRSQVYKNVEKKFTNSGYMPWSYKQLDSMEEFLKNAWDEKWIEDKTKYWWPQAAAISIYQFLWKEDVQTLVNLVKSDKTKKNADDVKEDLVYNFIKDKMDKVPLEKKPYGYFYMDLAYYLTRDIASKWKSKLELEYLQQSKVDRVLNTFMNRDSFELEQWIYKDTRDDILLEALYYSDKEAFSPYFTVTEWENDKEFVRFDSQYKWFIDWMNQVLMSAKDDNLDAYEVAFSSLVKTYKDKPEAAVAVYNELNKFLANNKDIENREEMLDWFLIKNSELLEDPELLKTKIWEDQYNELLFNIKRREEEINEKLLASKDPISWKWGWRVKSTDGKFKALPAIKKIAWDFKWWAPKYTWSPVSYAKPKSYLNSTWVNSGKKWSDFGKYNAESVSIFWEQKVKKDIKRSVKSIKRKLLTGKQLWIQKKKV